MKNITLVFLFLNFIEPVFASDSTNTDKFNGNSLTSEALKPPIDSINLIIGYKIWYGFGHIESKLADPLHIKVFVYDARTDQAGKNFRNELIILKDDVYDKLPEAFQFPNGIIRFFAFESQLPSILHVLSSFDTLWLKTSNGRVSIQSNERRVKP